MIRHVGLLEVLVQVNLSQQDAMVRLADGDSVAQVSISCDTSPIAMGRARLGRYITCRAGAGS